MQEPQRPHHRQISHTRQGIGESPISPLQRFVQEVSHIPDEFGLLVGKEMVCLWRHDLLRALYMLDRGSSSVSPLHHGWKIILAVQVKHWEGHVPKILFTSQTNADPGVDGCIGSPS